MFEILTGDVQNEVDSGASGRQTETHDDEDRRVRRDTHQHPEHHRQGQRGQQSLGATESAGKQINISYQSLFQITDIEAATFNSIPSVRLICVGGAFWPPPCRYCSTVTFSSYWS